MPTQAICGIHTNELSLRHIFKDIDGITSGPSSFSVPIGKEIKEDLTRLFLVQFDAIAGKVQVMPKNIVQELSTDQKYLYEIALAVQCGPEHCPDIFLTEEPGTLSNAKWNTLANRIFRLYISKQIPSPNLKRIVLNSQNTLQIGQKKPFSAMSTEVNLLHGVNKIMFVFFQLILVNNNQPYPMAPQPK